MLQCCAKAISAVQSRGTVSFCQEDYKMETQCNRHLMSLQLYYAFNTDSVYPHIIRAYPLSPF